MMIHLDQGIDGSGHRVWTVTKVQGVRHLASDRFDNRPEAIHWIRWTAPEGSTVHVHDGGEGATS